MLNCLYPQKYYQQYKLIKKFNIKQLINNIIINCQRNIQLTTTMANSKYDYVKQFETEDRIIPNCWIVVRVDGKAFHKFCTLHDFDKPNDENGLHLMNHAAIKVMKEYHDIILAYGQSDEYSFVFHKDTNLYNRRAAKIMSNVNSLFASSYVFHWREWFPSAERKLKYPPSFDARIILYPSEQNLKDYLSWRQADVHINNLYNTAFWNLVLNGGRTNSEAEMDLRGTFSADKNELLFSKFGINYNKLPIMYRKGTTLLRKRCKLPINVDQKELNETPTTTTTINATTKTTATERQIIIPYHIDMIKEKFWKDHFEILEKKSTQTYVIDDEQHNDEISLKLIYKQGN